MYKVQHFMVANYKLQTECNVQVTKCNSFLINALNINSKNVCSVCKRT